MTLKRVLPVLHLLHEDQVEEQARMICASGAHGMFLIDMGNSAIDTETAVQVVRSCNPDTFLGVNLLGHSMASAVVAVDHWPVDALWADNADLHVGQRALKLTTRLSVFGGVAFKYQEPVPLKDLSRLGYLASLCLDVPTTSGPGTGQPPDQLKLELLRSGFHPDSPARLAVASGVSPANASQILEVADDVLLATGIEREFGWIDQRLLDRVIQQAHAASH